MKVLKMNLEYEILRLFYEKIISPDGRGIIESVRIDFSNQTAEFFGVPYSELEEVLNKCFAKHWIKNSAMMGSRYLGVVLTKEGFSAYETFTNVEKSLKNRSNFKKFSDFIEGHKGIFTAMHWIVSVIALLVAILK